MKNDDGDNVNDSDALPDLTDASDTSSETDSLSDIEPIDERARSELRSIRNAYALAHSKERDVTSTHRISPVFMPSDQTNGDKSGNEDCADELRSVVILPLRRGDNLSAEFRLL